MKKVLGIIGLFLAVLIGIFIIFIGEESVRLKNDSAALPIIVTDKTKYCVSCLEEGKIVDVTYYSLGYKVKVGYTLSDKSHDDIKIVKVISKDFMLFNKYLLWGWIE